MRILFYNATQHGMAHKAAKVADILEQSLGEAHEVSRFDLQHSPTPSEIAGHQLVHIFGCWSRHASQLLHQAEGMNIPTVVSPLGGLQPWVLERHNVVARRGWQYQMIRDASAVVLGGKLEATNFKALGWNQHTGIIKNPVFTSLITPEELAAQTEAFYRKVLDSNATRRLTASAQQALGWLVAMGAEAEGTPLPANAAECREVMEGMSDEEWRTLFIYAHDEQVTDFLVEGISRWNQQADVLDVADIDRWTANKKYPEGDIECVEPLTHNPLMKNKIQDYITPDQAHERRLAIALLNAKHEVEKQHMPLRHLVNIYQLLRQTDIDEVRLADILSMLSLKGFAARLMMVMNRLLGLTEGFMPLPPKDDRQTRGLLRAITKFPTQR